jgi:uncharacterized membrane protein
MKKPLLLIAALLVAVAWRCASVWDQLPLRFASHFDGRGVANAFMPRADFFSVFAAVGGGTVLLLLAVPWLTRALPPRLLNIPNREYWLVPERRAQVQHKLGAFTAWTAAGCAFLLAAVLELVLRANLEHQALASGPMWLIVGLYMVGTSLSLVWLVRAFRVPGGANRS